MSNQETDGIDWSSAAEQLLRHWQRSGITHLPQPHQQIPQSIAEWSRASGSKTAATPQPQPQPKPQPTVPQTPPPPSRQIPAAPSKPVPPASSTQPQPPLSLTPWTNVSLDDNARADALKELNEQVKACRKCTDIVCRRMQTVFGIGPLRPKLVMVGEAPGADEDRAGEPFVGAAGQMLNKILAASGLQREQVYIMNTLKCRPPGNRTPVDAEIENCRPFFESQLEILQPEYIICWGSIAARAVLRRNDSVGRLRGRFYAYRNAKVMVTYHPSYLLRNPDVKHQTWDDMKMLMRELGITPPAR